MLILCAIISLIDKSTIKNKFRALLKIRIPINSTVRYKVLKKRGKDLAVANSRLFFLKDCA